MTPVLGSTFTDALARFAGAEAGAAMQTAERIMNTLPKTFRLCTCAGSATRTEMLEYLRCNPRPASEREVPRLSPSIDALRARF